MARIVKCNNVTTVKDHQSVWSSCPLLHAKRNKGCQGFWCPLFFDQAQYMTYKKLLCSPKIKIGILNIEFSRGRSKGENVWEQEKRKINKTNFYLKHEINSWERRKDKWRQICKARGKRENLFWVRTCWNCPLNRFKIWKTKSQQTWQALLLKIVYCISV